MLMSLVLCLSHKCEPGFNDSGMLLFELTFLTHRLHSNSNSLTVFSFTEENSNSVSFSQSQCCRLRKILLTRFSSWVDVVRRSCLFQAHHYHSGFLFTITAEIHALSLVNFYGQYADRHMNLKSCDASASESGKFDNLLS